MGAYRVEVTDTFAGEPNYCWVRRYVVPGSNESDRAKQIAANKRAIKRAAGLSGAPGSWDWYGDGGAFYLRGACVVILAHWDDTLDPEGDE